MLIVPSLVTLPPAIVKPLLTPPSPLTFKVLPLLIVSIALLCTSTDFISGIVLEIKGLFAVFGIITFPLLKFGTQAGFQLQAVFQSVLNKPVQVMFTLPGDETNGVQGLYVTLTFVLGSLVQVFVLVHLAK